MKRAALLFCCALVFACAHAVPSSGSPSSSACPTWHEGDSLVAKSAVGCVDTGLVTPVDGGYQGAERGWSRAEAPRLAAGEQAMLEHAPVHARFGVDPRVDLTQEQLLACGWSPAQQMAICTELNRFLLSQPAATDPRPSPDDGP